MTMKHTKTSWKPLLVCALLGLSAECVSAQDASGNDKPDKPEHETRGALREAADRVMEKTGVEHEHYSFGDHERGSVSVDRVSRDIGHGLEVGGFRSSTSDSYFGGDHSQGSKTYGGSIGFHW